MIWGIVVSEGVFLPAQFTWLLGEGSDLYACQRREATFARLLFNDLVCWPLLGKYVGESKDYLTRPIDSEIEGVIK